MLSLEIPDAAYEWRKKRTGERNMDIKRKKCAHAHVMENARTRMASFGAKITRSQEEEKKMRKNAT
jgi:hypothetical protein